MAIRIYDPHGGNRIGIRRQLHSRRVRRGIHRKCGARVPGANRLDIDVAAESIFVGHGDVVCGGSALRQIEIGRTHGDDKVRRRRGCDRDRVAEDRFYACSQSGKHEIGGARGRRGACADGHRTGLPWTNRSGIVGDRDPAGKLIGREGDASGIVSPRHVGNNGRDRSAWSEIEGHRIHHNVEQGLPYLQIESGVGGGVARSGGNRHCLVGVDGVVIGNERDHILLVGRAFPNQGCYAAGQRRGYRERDIAGESIQVGYIDQVGVRKAWTDLHHRIEIVRRNNKSGSLNLKGNACGCGLSIG